MTQMVTVWLAQVPGNQEFVVDNEPEAAELATSPWVSSGTHAAVTMYKTTACDQPAMLRRLDAVLEKAGLAVIIIISLGLFLDNVIRVIGLWNPTPCGDMVSQLLEMRAGTSWVTELLQPANEHVILFPRMLYLIDIFLFAATGKFLVTMNVLLAVATILFLAFVFGNHMGLSRSEWATYLCIVSILYFNGAHFFNLLVGFMIVHWLENFLMLAFAYTFARMVLAPNPSQRIKLALCLLPLSFGATFSSGNGILCVVTALFLSLLLRVNGKYLAYLALLLGAQVYLYLTLNPVLAHHKPAALLADWWNGLKFFLAFFGAPFMRYHVWPADQMFWTFEPAFAVLAGALVLTVGVVLCVRSWLDAERRDALTVFLIFIFVFLVGTGLLCANSRLPLGTYEGTNKKYANTVTLAWIAVFSLAVKQLLETRSLSGKQPFLGLAAAFGVFLTLVLPAHSREKRVWEDWKCHLWECEASLVTGVYAGGNFARGSDWRPLEYFHMAQDYLRPRGWTVFGRYPFAIGDAFATHFTADAQYPAIGNIDYLHLEPGGPNLAEGILVYGWAWDKQRDQPIQDIILVNQAGTIVGLAHSTRDRQDVRALIPHKPGLRCGWLGFARLSPQEGPLTAYAIVDRGGKAVCLGSKTVEATRPVDQLP